MDAAMDTEERTRLAVIIRDSEGLFISAEIKSFVGPINVFYAELAAILIGLHLLQEDQHENVILESDSLYVVQAIHSTEIGRSEAASLIQDIKRLLPSFQRWQIIHLHVKETRQLTIWQSMHY